MKIKQIRAIMQSSVRWHNCCTNWSAGAAVHDATTCWIPVFALRSCVSFSYFLAQGNADKDASADSKLSWRQETRRQNRK